MIPKTKKDILIRIIKDDGYCIPKTRKEAGCDICSQLCNAPNIVVEGRELLRRAISAYKRGHYSKKDLLKVLL